MRLPLQACAIAFTVGISSIPAYADDCLAPLPPFDYQLEPDDELFDEARREKRQHLLDLKGYLECLDREAFVTEKLLREGLREYRKTFGRETAAIEEDAAEDEEPPLGYDSPEVTPPGAYGD